MLYIKIFSEEDYFVLEPNGGGKSEIKIGHIGGGLNEFLADYS